MNKTMLAGMLACVLFVGGDANAIFGFGKAKAVAAAPVVVVKSGKMACAWNGVKHAASAFKEDLSLFAKYFTQGLPQAVATRSIKPALPALAVTLAVGFLGYAAYKWFHKKPAAKPEAGNAAGENKPAADAASGSATGNAADNLKRGK